MKACTVARALILILRIIERMTEHELAHAQSELIYVAERQ